MLWAQFLLSLRQEAHQAALFLVLSVSHRARREDTSPLCGWRLTCSVRITVRQLMCHTAAAQHVSIPRRVTCDPLHSGWELLCLILRDGLLSTHIYPPTPTHSFLLLPNISPLTLLIFPSWLRAPQSWMKTRITQEG